MLCIGITIDVVFISIQLQHVSYEMNRINWYRTGLFLGLIPICGLGLLLFVYWVGRAWFAKDFDITMPGFVYILVAIPIVLIGFILTAGSLITAKAFNPYRTLWMVLILFNVPLFFWILRTRGEISRRAYLKIINTSGRSFDGVTVIEPNRSKSFGSVDRDGDKIIFYNPDYASVEGIQNAGIGGNFLVIEIEGDTIRKKIPIIHPGEIHQLTIGRGFNLSHVHLNKMDFVER